MEYKMKNKAFIFETNGEVRTCRFALTPNQKNADCCSKKLFLIWFYEQKVLKVFHPKVLGNWRSFRSLTCHLHIPRKGASVMNLTFVFRLERDNSLPKHRNISSPCLAPPSTTFTFTSRLSSWPSPQSAKQRRFRRQLQLHRYKL